MHQPSKTPARIVYLCVKLAKRLAAKQAEKDRYIRTYAQGHISEEELDIYLADLKN